MERPTVRYARSPDGLSIAYQDFGEGPPLVFVAFCPFSHIQRESEISEVWRYLQEQARTSRVIRYDGRGNGLSDRSSSDFSLEAQVRDLETVIDHLGLERVALLGAALAAPAAILFAAMYPARVSNLILWHAYANGADLFGPALSAATSLAALDWEVFTQTAAHVAFGWEHGELAREYAEVVRAAVDQKALMENFPTVLSSPDVRRYLAQIQSPTLVMARRGVPEPGANTARELAAQIPGSRLMIMDAGPPTPYLGDSDSVLEAGREFLASNSVQPATAAETGATVALSKRETEVLSLLAGGRTGKEIAHELGISLSTVQRHIANIYTKLGARGRVDAAAYALARGLVRPRRA